MLRAVAAMGVVLAHVWQVLSILGLQKNFPELR
jgi:peptidoglycan/LPS O-acetylase OafA/YrhL